MTWDPTGLWASLILSVLGGVVAGVMVLVGEILFRLKMDRRQRAKAKEAIGWFFAEWEQTINAAGGRPDVQFAQHRLSLLMAQNIVARWSRYLTAEQVQVVSNLLQIEELVTGARLSGGKVWDLDHYDVFFRQVRGIEWLTS